MALVCINDDGVYLTCGNSYDMLSENGDYVKVINDVGKISEYHRTHFLSDEK